jgi:uncharacterized membrane protein HdeD (DUF308 family)
MVVGWGFCYTPAVARADQTVPFDRTRARLMSAAGAAMIVLSAGAALLPVEKGISTAVIGALLLIAGVIEVGAGSLRRDTRDLAMLAGGVTILAGLLFLLNQGSRFFPIVNIVIGWLALRSIILAIKSRRVEDSVRTWTSIAAATDFVLALVLLVGLSLSSVVVLLFGPTPAVVASFAWIVALSFVATGLLLLEVASCERDSADG